MNLVDWRIDHLCNESCLYCFACNRISVMSQNEEQIVIDKLCNSDVTVVNITGGEPMMNPSRCITLIHSLFKRGKKVYLSTNGLAFDEWKGLITELALLGLPLDGFDEASNHINGRGANSFKRVIDILSSNEARKTKIRIGTVVTRKSLERERLLKMAEMFDNYPIYVWRIYEVIPEARGAENKKLILSKEEKKLLQEIVNEISKTRHSYRIEFVTREMRSSSYFIVLPNGTVMVPIDCGEYVDEFVLGNLIDSGINELEEKWYKSVESFHYAQQRYIDVRGEKT